MGEVFFSETVKRWNGGTVKAGKRAKGEEGEKMWERVRDPGAG
jgi:hypothetical protein